MLGLQEAIETEILLRNVVPQYFRLRHIAKASCPYRSRMEKYHSGKFFMFGGHSQTELLL